LAEAIDIAAQEWQAGYPGDVSNLRHEDVQNWKGITLVV